MDKQSQASSSVNLFSPLPKHYVFNQTGNIMIATTGDANQLDDHFKAVCAEVSVFFATLTKAIHSVINPKTKQPYSIYNYKALRKVIKNSGMFVLLHEKEMTFETSDPLEVFGKEFFKSVLGISLQEDELEFAQETFGAMSKEADHIVQEKTRVANEAKAPQSRGIDIPDDKAESLENEDVEEEKVSNIIFVCESLLGMPIVSVIVTHARPEDLKEEHEGEAKGVHEAHHKEGFFKKIFSRHHEAGPEAPVKRTWNYQKDTYLFVSPQFFKDYVGGLSVANTPEFQRVMNTIQGYLLE
ncbi:hypothetical protein BKI52_22855 [marine bacterium AO1-C]|nr:hypothetical protein BKI52_22855 [marine bacterium AO1-C]